MCAAAVLWGSGGSGAVIRTSRPEEEPNVSDIQYERQNERVILAKQDGDEVARIVEVPGTNVTSFRMKDGSKRGDRVQDVDEAKKRIETYLN